VSVDTTPAGSAGSVGDRYRLLECVAGDPDGPAVAWRAWDNLLNRPVTLTVVRPGGPPAGGFLAHAHAVSTIVHPTLARVYDAVDEGARAYVVSEWVTGTPFTALLRDGALDPEAAASTVARVADGVAAAHAAGVAFGGVHPDHVVVTADGEVKLAQVVGDGRAAAGDDVRGLGALLYGALTAHWPLAATGGAAALRPATTSSGHLLSPRQVRAGVPEDLSTLAVRALDATGPHGLSSAAAMSTVLSERAGPGGDDVFSFADDRRERGRRSRWWARAIPVVAGLAVLALLGWVVGNALGGLPGGGDGGTPPAAADPSTSSPTAAPLRAVTPNGASLFDPRGDKTEDEGIDLSYDGKSATSWSTDRYRRNNTFGGLKEGMGIAYDFGEPTAVREITVSTDRPGTSIEILAGDSSPDGAQASAYTEVGSKADTASTNKITVKAGTTARYYIVWLTQLTSDNEGQYYGSLSEVSFRAQA
jgi:eukaryotic-like serine/threonine-protein kinase